MGNAMVSLRRLSQYLVMEERNDTVEQMPQVGLDVQGGQFYWSEPPATKKLEGVKGAPGQGKKRSLLSVFGGLRLRKGPAIGTGPAKGSGSHSLAMLVATYISTCMCCCKQQVHGLCVQGLLLCVQFCVCTRGCK